MGATEKKRRREISRVLHDYSFVYRGGTFPLKASKSAADMLLEYSRPLLDVVKELRTAIALGVFSWNVSLAPTDERPKLIEEYIVPTFAGSAEIQVTVRKLIAVMIERRERYYRDEPVYYVANRRAAEPAEERNA